jgi:hypothetical protein
MLRIALCLGYRVTNGGKVVSATHRPLSIPQEHNFSASGTYFCSKPEGLVRSEGKTKQRKIVDLIGSGTRYVPASCIVP